MCPKDRALCSSRTRGRGLCGGPRCPAGRLQCDGSRVPVIRCKTRPGNAMMDRQARLRGSDPQPWPPINNVAPMDKNRSSADSDSRSPNAGKFHEETWTLTGACWVFGLQDAGLMTDGSDPGCRLRVGSAGLAAASPASWALPRRKGVTAVMRAIRRESRPGSCLLSFPSPDSRIRRWRGGSSAAGAGDAGHCRAESVTDSGVRRARRLRPGGPVVLALPAGTAERLLHAHAAPCVPRRCRACGSRTSSPSPSSWFRRSEWSAFEDAEHPARRGRLLLAVVVAEGERARAAAAVAIAAVDPAVRRVPATTGGQWRLLGFGEVSSALESFTFGLIV